MQQLQLQVFLAKCLQASHILIWEAYPILPDKSWQAPSDWMRSVCELSFSGVSTDVLWIWLGHSGTCPEATLALPWLFALNHYRAKRWIMTPVSGLMDSAAGFLQGPLCICLHLFLNSDQLLLLCILSCLMICAVWHLFAWCYMNKSLFTFWPQFAAQQRAEIFCGKSLNFLIFNHLYNFYFTYLPTRVLEPRNMDSKLFCSTNRPSAKQPSHKAKWKVFFVN